MQIVCPECSNELKQEPSDILTPMKIYKYQCDYCYFVSDGVEIYNINGYCSVCLKSNANKTVLACGHWYCQYCQYCIQNCKSNKCPLCQIEYPEYLEKEIIKGNEYKINIPDQFKKSFQKLYKRLFNKIDKYIMLNYYTCHEKTVTLLEEYYKWLTILSKYGEIENLSPGSLIDLAWHEHILDIHDYIDICNQINGKLMLHNPEDSFNPVKSKRLMQISSTYKYYDKMYGGWQNDLIKLYWKQWTTGKIFQQYYSIKDHKIVFVKDLEGSVVTFPFTKNTTVEELKFMIFDFNGISPCEQRLIHSGKQLEDGLSLKTHYNIMNESTIHLVLRLCGC